MKKLFDLEGFGISRSDNMNSYFNEVLEEFVNSAKLIENLYPVRPTGNENSQSQQYNYIKAENCLSKFFKEFKKNRELHSQYKDIT